MCKKLLVMSALLIGSMTSLMAYEYAGFESYDGSDYVGYESYSGYEGSYEAAEVCDDQGCISVESYSN